MTEKSIPVARFAALMKQAEKAVKANDLASLEAVNAEIEQIGYRVIVRNGETLVQQLYFNPATERFECPPPLPPAPKQNSGSSGKT